MSENGWGFENFALSDEDEQHRFGMIHCRNCGGDELELDESGDCFRYDRSDGTNRLVCVKCGPQDEFPVRDVVWGDHHEALIAAYDDALTDLERQLKAERSQRRSEADPKPSPHANTAGEDE